MYERSTVICIRVESVQFRLKYVPYSSPQLYGPKEAISACPMSRVTEESLNEWDETFTIPMRYRKAALLGCRLFMQCINLQAPYAERCNTAAKKSCSHQATTVRLRRLCWSSPSQLPPSNLRLSNKPAGRSCSRPAASARLRRFPWRSRQLNPPSWLPHEGCHRQCYVQPTNSRVGLFPK